MTNNRPTVKAGVATREAEELAKLTSLQEAGLVRIWGAFCAILMMDPFDDLEVKNKIMSADYKSDIIHSKMSCTNKNMIRTYKL